MCRPAHEAPGAPYADTRLFVPREGVMLNLEQWARVRARTNCQLRRGAWYRVVELAPLDVVLEVNRRPLRVPRSEEHTSELQSQSNLVCRLLLEKKKKNQHVTVVTLHDMLLRHTVEINIARHDLRVVRLGPLDAFEMNVSAALTVTLTDVNGACP